MNDYDLETIFDYSYNFSLFILLFFFLFIIAVEIVSVIICNIIAKGKGLPKSYMWFGLLGVVGIIIVAVINPPRPVFPPPYGNYTPQQPYQYQQPPVPQPQADIQVKNKKICAKCGAASLPDAVFCFNCGNKF